MTKAEKNQQIAELAETLSNNAVIYLTDIEALDAETTSKLRRLCFNRQVELRVVKNKLLQKAMEQVSDKNFGEMPSVLKGNTSLMLSEVGNLPAKLIKDFRKNADKPVLKAAYVEEAVFIGEENLDALANLKSKDELIADVIALLQSPAKNVISQLSSGKDKLAGIVKALSEKEA
jgi:large subunit ribosomal protein L10